MKTLDRWCSAQKYEEDWWKLYEKFLSEGKASLDWYKTFSEECCNYVSPFLEITSETPILEIGSGAAGLITYLNSTKKIAIDPLEHYFGSSPVFCRVRDPNIKYLAARGEEIPFEDAVFDMVIADNMLDHCKYPLQVLDEIHRVLRGNGVLFLKLNIFTRSGIFPRKILERFVIDRGHPHSFSHEAITEDFGKCFAVLSETVESYLDSWKRNLRRWNRKILGKMLLGILELKYVAVLRKK